MIRLLVLLALATTASASHAQNALTRTDAQFRSDLETVARVTATVGLIHDATGAFPATPFELLGSPWAEQTGLRDVPLSTVSVQRTADGVRVAYNPLPRPYVSDDLLAEVSVSRDADGDYTAAHELRRRADPDLGGRALPYDRAGNVRVDEAGGRLCVDTDRVRALLADGTFAASLPDLDGDGLPVRVRSLDGADRVLYTSESVRVDA